MASHSKYNENNLLPMLRKAAQLRNEMLLAGFTDNGGAIHSAERILDLLSYRIKYTGLTHVNNARNHPDAEFSLNAWEAFKRGEKVLVEHVAPIREYTRMMIEKITLGESDAQLIAAVKKVYRLCLLTADEAHKLNRINRSRIHEDRLAQASISTCRPRDERSG